MRCWATPLGRPRRRRTAWFPETLTRLFSLAEIRNPSVVEFIKRARCRSGYERDDARRRIVVTMQGPFTLQDFLAVIERQQVDNAWGYGISTISAA